MEQQKLPQALYLFIHYSNPQPCHTSFRWYRLDLTFTTALTFDDHCPIKNQCAYEPEPRPTLLQRSNHHRSIPHQITQNKTPTTYISSILSNFEGIKQLSEFAIAYLE